MDVLQLQECHLLSAVYSPLCKVLRRKGEPGGDTGLSATWTSQAALAEPISHRADPISQGIEPLLLGALEHAEGHGSL